MLPARAYASTAIGGQYGSAVECAVETLGVSWGSLTADQQSYLFNVTTSTEGMDQFAVFKNSLHEFTPSSGLGGNAYYSTLEGSMYAVVATNARRQLAAYIQGTGSGGSGGGSGGSGGSGGGVPSTITLEPNYPNTFVIDGVQYTNNAIYSNGSTMCTSCVVRLDSQSMETLGGLDFDTYKYIYIGADTVSVNIYAFQEPMDWTQGTVRGVTYKNKLRNNTGSRQSYINLSRTPTKSIQGGALNLEVSNINQSYGTLNSGDELSISKLFINDASSGGGGGSGGGDEPTEPDPTPTPPTNPTGPTVTGPTVNINTGGNNSSTTTADLTPILEMLRIINDNIGIVNGNITDFETWFYQTWQNYVDWLQLWFERFGQSLDNIYAQQELVGNNIVDELREIEDVLWNIFYKPDPEFPTSTPYDDTQLQGILNGMWADNNGYLNAIQNLLMQISGQIDGLDDVYTPHVGTGKTTQEQLNEDVARLKRKFPFSIPWDLYALLQFLQAPPSAPTFSFTLPYMGTLQCDLSVFDDVAAVCRWVSLLWFVAGLLACTNKLLNLMNVFERND